MCGIFLHFTKDGIIRKEVFKQLLCQYSSIEHRGPDRHTLSLFGNCIAGLEEDPIIIPLEVLDASVT
jgi:asparagine synthetase B (glutamine-hydrolysing)